MITMSRGHRVSDGRSAAPEKNLGNGMGARDRMGSEETARI